MEATQQKPISRTIYNNVFALWQHVGVANQGFSVLDAVQMQSKNMGTKIQSK